MLVGLLIDRHFVLAYIIHITESAIYTEPVYTVATTNGLSQNHQTEGLIRRPPPVIYR